MDAEGEAASGTNRKGRKRKKKYEPGEAVSQEVVPVHIDDLPDDAIAEPVQEEDVPSDQNEGAWNWPKEDIQLLIEKIQTTLPPKSNKRYTAALAKIKWQDLEFNDHTAEELRSKWLEIQSNLRTHRTLSELVSDAKDWLSAPWKSVAHPRAVHPEYPKKPATPFFRFYAEQRAKYAEENPDASRAEVSKMMAAKFDKMSDRKKRKYVEPYEQEREAHKEAVAEFRKKFPDFHFKKEKRKIEKPMTPLQVFLKSKLGEDYADPDAHVDQMDQLEEEWHNLSEKRKIKYIRKAADDKLRYEQEKQQITESRSQKQSQNGQAVRMIKNLTKEEQQQLDTFDGKPVKPPSNGYLLYYKETIDSGDLPEMSLNKRNKLLGVKWKEMDKLERKEYAARAKQLMAEYEKAQEEYRATHPGEEQEEERMASLEKLASDSEVSQRAYSSYQTERIATLQQKDETADVSKFINITFNEWTAMTLKEKEKYFETVVKDADAADFGGPPLSLVETQMIQNLTAMQPAKPPRSGYTLFSQDYMKKCQDVHPGDRMLLIGNEWKKVTQAEKDRYHELYKDAVRRYEKQMQEFKSSLKSDSLNLFETYVQNKSVKSIHDVVRSAIKRLEVLGVVTADKQDEAEPVKKKRRKRKASAALAPIDPDPEMTDGDEADVESGAGSQELVESQRTPQLRPRVRALKDTPAEDEPLDESEESEDSGDPIFLPQYDSE